MRLGQLVASGATLRPAWIGLQLAGLAIAAAPALGLATPAPAREPVIGVIPGEDVVERTNHYPRVAE